MTARIHWCAVLALSLVACGQTPAPTQAEMPANVASPVTAVNPGTTVDFPTFALETIEGDTYDLASRRGHWVVVNFWATWCAPCIKEMPELSALDAANTHIEVIGLAYEEIDREAMLEFLRERPVVYPIAILDVYAPPADFATPRGLPMTYLIAPDGKVAQQFLGPVTAHQLEAAIVAGGGPKVAG